MALRWFPSTEDDVAWQTSASDLTPFSRGEGPGETITFRPRSHARLEAAGVTDGLAIESRKPEWLRPKVRLDAGVVSLKKTMRELSLVNATDERDVTANKVPAPELQDRWLIKNMTFARREPKKAK